MQCEPRLGFVRWSIWNLFAPNELHSSFLSRSQAVDTNTQTAPYVVVSGCGGAHAHRRLYIAINLTTFNSINNKFNFIPVLTVWSKPPAPHSQNVAARRLAIMLTGKTTKAKTQTNVVVCNQRCNCFKLRNNVITIARWYFICARTHRDKLVQGVLCMCLWMCIANRRCPIR